MDTRKSSQAQAIAERQVVGFYFPLHDRDSELQEHNHCALELDQTWTGILYEKKKMRTTKKLARPYQEYEQNFVKSYSKKVPTN